MLYVSNAWVNSQKILLLVILVECPPNWLVGNNGTSCYFPSYTRLNFTDANLWCQASQSRLLEITNGNLFTALQSNNQSNLYINHSYWIGLREVGPNRSRSLLFHVQCTVSERIFLDVYKWVTSGSNFANSNYFCPGYPAHGYNYYFQQYDQCLGLYIQSNTSACLRDSTCPNIASFICELCKFDLLRSSF